MPHSHLIQLFNRQFQHTENTVLKGGADEPLYTPADADRLNNTVFFTRDYFSSALHEVAHWVLAGSERRQQVDYGYWYAPDGRTADQQAQFEQVEVKPQAIEWIFSLAAGVKFNISADNLDAALGASDNFKHAVWQQACDYLDRNSLPPRAQQFSQALQQHFGTQLHSGLLHLSSL